MKKAIRVISNILFVTFTVSLILAIFVFLIPRFTSIQYRAVRTGSMEPDIPVGSMVVVVPTPADEIKIGDDVTYITRSNQVVTHRVLEIDRETNTFTTYGIANGVNNTDPPLAYENIIGVARFHIPWIGPAITYLDTLSGKIVTGTVLLSVFILSLLLSTIVSGKKQKKTQKVLLMDRQLAGKDYRSYLNEENNEGGNTPLRPETSSGTEGQKPSVIEKPAEDKKPELQFGKNYLDYTVKKEPKKKKQRAETTDEFWNEEG